MGKYDQFSVAISVVQDRYIALNTSGGVSGTEMAEYDTWVSRAKNARDAGNSERGIDLLGEANEVLNAVERRHHIENGGNLSVGEVVDAKAKATPQRGGFRPDHRKQAPVIVADHPEWVTVPDLMGNEGKVLAAARREASAEDAEWLARSAAKKSQSKKK